MKKTIARVLIAGAAAAAFALPATPASASCSVTIQDCIDELLGTTSPAVPCVMLGHTPVICPGPIST